jgi:hypothetical protein
MMASMVAPHPAARRRKIKLLASQLSLQEILEPKHSCQKKTDKYNCRLKVRPLLLLLASSAMYSIDLHTPKSCNAHDICEARALSSLIVVAASLFLLCCLTEGQGDDDWYKRLC